MENIGPPPDGGDRNKATAFIATESVFISISTILVALRFYVRTRVVKKPGWDDFHILLALLLAIAAFGTGIAATHSGIGQHEYYLSTQEQVKALKLQTISEAITVLAITFTKISICVFLLRFFVTKRRWKWMLYSIILINIVFNLPVAIIQVFSCRPIAKKWDPSIPGVCVQILAHRFDVAQGVVGVIIDFTLASLPVAFLWNVHIKLENKVGICILMALGLLATACTIARIILLNKADPTLPLDPTWKILDFWIWAILEQLFGIIAATIPTLRPFFTRKLHNSSKGYVLNGYDTRWLEPTYPTRDPFGLESQIKTPEIDRNPFDNTSEEVILPLHNVHGITKMTKISIKDPPEL